MRRLGALVVENLNGLIVLAGAVWLYVGIRGVSPPSANIVAGAGLVLLGVTPYLLRLRQRKP